MYGPSAIIGIDIGQFLLPLGTLLVTGGIGPDEGMAIWAHQAAPDTHGPAVGYHIPRPSCFASPIRVQWVSRICAAPPGAAFPDGAMMAKDALESANEDETGHQHGESCEHHHHHPRQHFVPKIGRNEPCPCGSGRKRKKCCLGKEGV